MDSIQRIFSPRPVVIVWVEILETGRDTIGGRPQGHTEFRRTIDVSSVNRQVEIFDGYTRSCSCSLTTEWARLEARICRCRLVAKIEHDLNLSAYSWFLTVA